MIDQLMIAIAAVSSAQESNIKNREENYVIVGKSRFASSLIYGNDFFEQMGAKNPLATYQQKAVSLINDNQMDVSPPLRSFTVTAPIIFRGRGVQPPIDEEDTVYFDE